MFTISILSLLAATTFAADVAPSDPCARFEKGTQVYTSCVTVQFVESQLKVSEQLTSTQIDALTAELVKQDALRVKGEAHDQATDEKIAALEKQLADLKAQAAAAPPTPAPAPAPMQKASSSIVGQLNAIPITAYTGSPKIGDTGVDLTDVSLSFRFDYLCLQVRDWVGVGGGQRIHLDTNGDGVWDTVETCAPTSVSDVVLTGVRPNEVIHEFWVNLIGSEGGVEVYGISQRGAAKKTLLGMQKIGS